MKTLFILLTSLLLALPVAAQTNTEPAIKWADSIKHIIELNPEAQNATNWTVAIAPSYAPGLKDVDGSAKEWGVTAALLYPLGKYVYAGARVDYIGADFFLPSVGVELKTDIRLFNKVDVTPFAVTGVSYSVSGDADTEGEVGAIYGSGVKVHIATVKKVRIGGFFEYERWTTFKDVDVFHAGLTANFSF